MIFLTVGTTSFDELVEKVDFLAGEGKIKDKVIAQIGRGQYIPKNVEYFKYKDSIEDDLKKADLVVAHGGAGTTFEVLKMGKRLVSVVNRSLSGDHQTELISELDKQEYLIKCDKLDDLEECLRSKKQLKSYSSPKCTIHEEINKLTEVLK